MSLNNLEHHAISNFTELRLPSRNLPVTEENVALVGIKAALHIGRLLQDARLLSNIPLVEYKDDGTRVTLCDVEGERIARAIISRSFPGHDIIGEEGGGTLNPSHYCWVIDPVDSTNSFISHENTSAVSICLMHEGKMLFSTVYNPFTGELYYTIGSEKSRLIQSYGFNPEHSAHDLPLLSGEPNSTSRFVNIHPTPENNDALQAMIRARARGEIQKVLQQGGSPSLNIASITKGGHFGVVHHWNHGPAQPWDLASALHIVRGAGGFVTDSNGADVPLVGHTGMLVASMNASFQETLLQILRS